MEIAELQKKQRAGEGSSSKVSCGGGRGQKEAARGYRSRGPEGGPCRKRASGVKQKEAVGSSKSRGLEGGPSK